MAAGLASLRRGVRRPCLQLTSHGRRKTAAFWQHSWLSTLSMGAASAVVLPAAQLMSREAPPRGVAERQVALPQLQCPAADQMRLVLWQSTGGVLCLRCITQSFAGASAGPGGLATKQWVHIASLLRRSLPKNMSVRKARQTGFLHGSETRDCVGARRAYRVATLRWHPDKWQHVVGCLRLSADDKAAVLARVHRICQAINDQWAAVQRG